MLSYSFIFIFASLFFSIALFVGILLFKRNNQKSLYIKNILLYIGLIIFSGIIYLFYEKLFNNLGIEQWHSIFIGIVVMLGIWFFNFVGIILSILKINKIYLTLIIYGLFMVLTILTYNIVNIIGKILEDNKYISDCSSILLIGIMMIIENLFSYIVVKIIIRINNRVRSNCT
jgi:uncharacterized membrane protein YgdD (TMEM256/DUF423 family)